MTDQASYPWDPYADGLCVAIWDASFAKRGIEEYFARANGRTNAEASKNKRNLLSWLARFAEHQDRDTHRWKELLRDKGPAGVFLACLSVQEIREAELGLFAHLEANVGPAGRLVAANILWRGAIAGLGIADSPDKFHEGFCEKREGAWFLDTNRSREYLSREALGSPRHLWTARLFAAFAILQPEDASGIRAAMLTSQHSSTFEGLVGVAQESLFCSDSKLIGAAEPPKDPADADIQRGDRSQGSGRQAAEAPPDLTQEAAAQPRDADLADSADLPRAVSDPIHNDGRNGDDTLPEGKREMLRLIRMKPPLAEQLSPSELDQAARLFEAEARCCDESLRELEEAKMQFQTLMDEIASHPLLVTQITKEALEGGFGSGAEATADAQRRKLRQHIASGTSVLQTLRQVSALNEKLGRQGEISLAGVEFSFNSLEDQLQRQQEELEVLLKAMVEQERLVDELREFLAITPPQQSEAFAAAIGPDTWAALIQFADRRCPTTDMGRKSAALCGQRQLIGLALNCLYRRDPIAASRVLCDLLQAARTEESNVADLCSFLTYSQQQGLAEATPCVGEQICEMILLSSADRGLELPFAYLSNIVGQGHLGPASSAFFRSVIGVHRSGRLTTLKQVCVSLAGRTKKKPGEWVEDQRQRVLAVVDATRSMTGHYQRLRQIAKHLYVEPLRPFLDNKDAKSAVRRWKEWGDLDTKTENCIGASGLRRRLEGRHVEQTRNYLQHFEDELFGWSDMATSLSDEACPDLEMAAQRLREAANTSQGAARLLGSLLTLESGHSPVPRDFGVRCDSDGNIDLAGESTQVLVDPTMLSSWPRAAANDQVPVECVLYDMLRSLLDGQEISPSQALEYYLSERDFVAALAACEEDESLRTRFDAAMRQQRDSLLASKHELLKEAKTAREFDELIGLALDELQEAINIYDFPEAEKLLEAIEGFLLEYRQRHDPERKMLESFLAEAGIKVPTAATTQELEQDVEVLIEECAGRRRHIFALERAAEDSGLPESLRGRWRKAARRIDRPKLWPEAQVSAQIQMSVDRIASFLSGKLRYHTYMSGGDNIIDAIVDGVETWLPVEIDAALENAVSPAPASGEPRICILSNSIHDGCPESHVLQEIGRGGGAHEPVDGSSHPDPPEIPISAPTDHVEVASELPSSDAAAATCARIRESLTEVRAERIERREGQAHHDIYEAIERQAWGGALGFARDALAQEMSDEGPMKFEECSGLVSLAMVRLGNQSLLKPRLTQDSLLAALHQLTVLDQHDPVYRSLRGVVPSLLLAGLGLRDNVRTNSETSGLADALNELRDMPSVDSRFTWFSELLIAGTPLRGRDDLTASQFLVRSVWEHFTGESDVGKLRANLLFVLFRLGRDELIVHLARQHIPKMAGIVANFIDLNRQVAGNPAAVPEANRLGDVIQEQSREHKTIRPWVLLAQRLRHAPKESGDTESCMVACENGVRLGDDSVVLHVRVEPSRYDYPESLTISFDADISSIRPHGPISLLDDTRLSRQQIIRCELPLKTGARPTDLVYLPYVVEGVSITGRPIRIQGRWTVPPEATYRPLSQDELGAYWPGAAGSYVTTPAGFYGRKAEKGRIEKMIAGNGGRQQSAVIIGQRRIGKTSLIIDVQQSYKLDRQHRVAAIFADMSNVAYDTPGHLKEIVFNHILDNILVDPTKHNRHLSDIMALDVSDMRRLRRRVSRECEPARCLSTALTYLQARLSEYAKIDGLRLALFLDEFQSLFQRTQDEVDALMWDLRQIVQHSESISLFMAGSGLTKTLTTQYESALFGSIETIELLPFNWERDQEAIAALLIPHGIRGEWAGQQAEVVDLAEHAAIATGGHPYYLSMLGYAVAKLYGRTPITVPMLNEAIERMLSTRIDTHGGPIEASTFYKYLFHDLDGMSSNERVALAKLLLANLSRQVSVAWPEMLVSDVLDVPGLSLHEASKHERVTAFQLLKTDGVIQTHSETGAVRCRVQVPIVGAAIKRMAMEIEQEALWQLKI